MENRIAFNYQLDIIIPSYASLTASSQQRAVFQTGVTLLSRLYAAYSR